MTSTNLLANAIVLPKNVNNSTIEDYIKNLELETLSVSGGTVDFTNATIDLTGATVIGLPIPDPVVVNNIEGAPPSGDITISATLTGTATMTTNDGPLLLEANGAGNTATLTTADGDVFVIANGAGTDIIVRSISGNVSVEGNVNVTFISPQILLAPVNTEFNMNNAFSRNAIQLLQAYGIGANTPLIAAGNLQRVEFPVGPQQFFAGITNAQPDGSIVAGRWVAPVTGVYMITVEIQLFLGSTGSGLAIGPYVETSVGFRSEDQKSVVGGAFGIIFSGYSTASTFIVPMSAGDDVRAGASSINSNLIVGGSDGRIVRFAVTLIDRGL